MFRHPRASKSESPREDGRPKHGLTPSAQVQGKKRVGNWIGSALEDRGFSTSFLPRSRGRARNPRGSHVWEQGPTLISFLAPPFPQWNTRHRGEQALQCHFLVRLHWACWAEAVRAVRTVQCTGCLCRCKGRQQALGVLQGHVWPCASASCVDATS